MSKTIIQNHGDKVKFYFSWATAPLSTLGELNVHINKNGQDVFEVDSYSGLNMGVPDYDCGQNATGHPITWVINLQGKNSPVSGDQPFFPLGIKTDSTAVITHGDHSRDFPSGYTIDIVLFSDNSEIQICIKGI